MSNSRGLLPDIARVLFGLVILFAVIGVAVIGLLLLSIFIWKSISLSVVFGICLLIQLVFTFKMIFSSKTTDID
jgi:ABC-type transport system involved in multi-copper enzyme maturation permease subunit